MIQCKLFGSIKTSGNKCLEVGGGATVVGVPNNKVTVFDFDSVESLIAGKSLFDVLIVDEAQDLLSATIMARLVHLLKNGLEHCRWRMFLDPNNQSSLHAPMEPEVLERIVFLSHCGGSNCRVFWRFSSQKRRRPFLSLDRFHRFDLLGGVGSPLAKTKKQSKAALVAKAIVERLIA
jgi:hypothetical protein